MDKKRWYTCRREETVQETAATRAQWHLRVKTASETGQIQALLFTEVLKCGFFVDSFISGLL